jgi:hypothetical protein
MMGETVIYQKDYHTLRKVVDDGDDVVLYYYGKKCVVKGVDEELELNDVKWLCGNEWKEVWEMLKGGAK